MTLVLNRRYTASEASQELCSAPASNKVDATSPQYRHLMAHDKAHQSTIVCCGQNVASERKGSVLLGCRSRSVCTQQQPGPSTNWTPCHAIKVPCAVSYITISVSHYTFALWLSGLLSLHAAGSTNDSAHSKALQHPYQKQAASSDRWDIQPNGLRVGLLSVLWLLTMVLACCTG